jgi:hypothetical protein
VDEQGFEDPLEDFGDESQYHIPSDVEERNVAPGKGRAGKAAGGWHGDEGTRGFLTELLGAIEKMFKAAIDQCHYSTDYSTKWHAAFGAILP